MRTKISNSGIISNATARRAFTATFALAMVLTFGCSNGPDDDTSSSSGGNGNSSSSLDTSSSSSDNSSSSLDGSSSSSEDSSSSSSFDYGILTYEGKDYKTIIIGGQNWMAENLNYNVTGSLCYDNLPANCEKYGRLYDWATAMGIEQKYNSTLYYSSSSEQSSSSSEQLSSSSYARGICPDGWHIPSNEEWDELYCYVDSDYCSYDEEGNIVSSNISSLIAGEILKAKSGWTGSGNGIDSLGFAALPGGNRFDDGDFDNAGYDAYWLSASEFDSESAYIRNIYYDEKHAYKYTLDKTYLFSVRCLED